MTKLEDGYHKWVCFDHSHPHIFKKGKCINCGMDGYYTANGQILELTIKGVHETALDTED